MNSFANLREKLLYQVSPNVDWKPECPEMCGEISGMVCDKYILSLIKRTQNLNLNQDSRYNLCDFQVLW